MKIIFDVDGTLLDIGTRRQHMEGGISTMNWEKFMDPAEMAKDVPNQPVVDIAIAMEKAGHEIIVVSARNERHREVTENSLQEAGVQFQHLFLRSDGDFRKDSEFKQEVLDALIAQDWKPNLVFDDRNQVVAMWRSNGLTCVQVAEGDF
jgi:uncharacterized HAD superfamily protein